MSVDAATYVGYSEDSSFSIEDNDPIGMMGGREVVQYNAQQLPLILKTFLKDLDALQQTTAHVRPLGTGEVSAEGKINEDGKKEIILRWTYRWDDDKSSQNSSREERPSNDHDRDHQENSGPDKK